VKTRTYAEICARQGELAQAIAIYADLIAKSPDDASLLQRKRELENLRDGVTPVTEKKSPRVARLEQLLHRITSRRRKT
jgi:hypothetical protein